MVAAPHPLPRTCNPLTDTPPPPPPPCHGKHHPDVQTGDYIHITIKARQEFWLKTSIYPHSPKVPRVLNLLFFPLPIIDTFPLQAHISKH